MTQVLRTVRFVQPAPLGSSDRQPCKTDVCSLSPGKDRLKTDLGQGPKPPRSQRGVERSTYACEKKKKFPTSSKYSSPPPWEETQRPSWKMLLEPFFEETVY